MGKENLRWSCEGLGYRGDRGTAIGELTAAETCWVGRCWLSMLSLLQPLV